MGNTVDFGPFRLDLRSGELYVGDARIPLQDKPFRILAMLLQRPGELVSRDELRRALWSDGTFVDFEHGLNTAIKRLRDALKDSAASPCFIETVPRRGYRFIGTVAEMAAARADLVPLVGREREVDLLRRCLSRSLTGARQCVFVTGDPGIGKSALVARFLQDAAQTGGLAVSEGRALERYGTADAYGPVLEAVQALALAHPPLVDIVNRHAPTWLSHLPSLACRALPATPGAAPAMVTQARMLREMLGALEAAAAQRPLVLVLEDLHWGDASTVEFVSAVARGRAVARLLLICSYRSPEAIASDHAIHRVTQELQGYGRAVELALTGLKVPAIQAYLAVRVPGLVASEEFAAALARRTQGNPLFLLNCVEALLSDQQIIDVDGTPAVQCDPEAVQHVLPSSLTQLIARQLQQMPADEQGLMYAASVIGPRFSVPLVATITDRHEVDVDRALAGLSERSDFLGRPGVTRSPNGPLPGHYHFAHPLYPHVLYNALAPEHVSRLHRRIAEALETQPCGSSDVPASQLALHFDLAGLPARAVPYYARAADVGLRRGAHSEAAQHVRRALQLLAHQAPGPDRDEQELALHLQLGAALSGIYGLADMRVEQAFSRALALCERLPGSPHLVPALLGVSRFYGSRGPTSAALHVTRMARDQAHRASSPAVLLEAHYHCAAAEFFAGDLVDAEQSNDRAWQVLKGAGRKHPGLMLTGLDARRGCLMERTIIRQYRGWLREASMHLGDLRNSMPDIIHANERGVMLFFLTALEALTGDVAYAISHAEQLVSHSETDEGIVSYLPFAYIVLGRGRHTCGELDSGSTQVEDGLTQVIPSWLPLASGLTAESLIGMECWERGVAVVDQALAASARSGMQYHDAELLRLRGELLHHSDFSNRADQGHDSLRRALTVARAQGARWFELRVALSMHRWARRADAVDQAARSLADVVSSLDDEDCAELREARAILGRH